MAQIARRNADAMLMDNQRRRKEVHIRILPLLEIISQGRFEKSVQPHAHRFAHALDQPHNGNTMRSLEIGRLARLQFQTQHFDDLPDEVHLFELVQHMNARMDSPNGK